MQFVVHYDIIFYGHLHLHLTSAEEKIIYRYIIQFYLITRTSEILKISGITAQSYGRFQPYLFIALYQKGYSPNDLDLKGKKSLSQHKNDAAVTYSVEDNRAAFGVSNFLSCYITKS